MKLKPLFLILTLLASLSALDIVKGATTHGYVAYYANEVINGTQPESITLNKTSLDLKSGESDTLVATVLPEGSTYDIVWTSSDEAVATVDNDGKVTALGVGSATITATCGSVSATCSVTTSMLESFSAVNADGVTIYYRITSSTAPYTVEVTYKDKNYNSYAGNVNIPKSVTKFGVTYSVTSIGEKAFYMSNGLISVTIPEGVTSIGNYAISGCTGLITLNYNATNCVQMSGKYVFKDCPNLKTLNIGENVKTIPSNGFAKCTGLTMLVIPEGVNTIEGTAFNGCSGLTSVTIPESVTSIGGYAFGGCTGLGSLVIPEGVISIGECAFGGCTGLTKLDYNATNCTTHVQVANMTVFRGCSNLKTLNIGKNVQTIPDNTFTGCTGLTTVTIPNSIVS